MSGTLKRKENWSFKLVNNITGKTIEEWECNAVVNVGKERVAKLLNGVNTAYYRAIAIGTGTTAVTATDTSLETEEDRQLATLSYEADYKAKFTKTFTFASNKNITEAGIFDSTTVTASTMLNRTVFSAKAVSSSIDLIVTCLITVA